MVETMDEVLKIALAEPLPAIAPPTPTPTGQPIVDDTITH